MEAALQILDQVLRVFEADMHPQRRAFRCPTRRGAAAFGVGRQDQALKAAPAGADAEKVDIAQTIGIGAVKYADLSQYRMTDYVFSWDKMLALQGNTAPYLQNTYVRVRSIFRKAGEAAAKIETFVLNEAAEITLAKRLCQFAEIVPQVLNDFRPNILANYLFELANSFHAFYEACPVLRSDEPVRSSRLALCDLTGRVLQRGLDLLGIKVPEKM